MGGQGQLVQEEGKARSKHHLPAPMTAVLSTLSPVQQPEHCHAELQTPPTSSQTRTSAAGDRRKVRSQEMGRRDKGKHQHRAGCEAACLFHPTATHALLVPEKLLQIHAGAIPSPPGQSSVGGGSRPLSLMHTAQHILCSHVLTPFAYAHHTHLEDKSPFFSSSSFLFFIQRKN